MPLCSDPLTLYPAPNFVYTRTKRVFYVGFSFFTTASAISGLCPGTRI